MTGTVLRRLPVTAPPACFESLDSYIGRLADINRISTDELREALGRPGFSTLEGRLSADQVSTLTGYAADRLLAGLIELRTDHWPLPNVFTMHTAPACPRCAHSHPGRQLHRYYPHHAPACPKHNIWTGTGWYPEGRAHDRFIDISRSRTIIAAQRRHHQFVRRHGAKVARDGFILARNVLGREDWPRPTASTEQILAILRPDGPLPYPDPAHEAARYPRLIHLATLFIAPHWRKLAASHTTWPQFYAEFSTRCFGHPDYVPNSNNAICRWVRQQVTW